MASCTLVFIILAVALSVAGHSAGASWCVCKGGDPKTLQTTLDYACGHGADCAQIHQAQACYAPNTVASHCNYAVNSYFQKNNQLPTACDFSGTAGIVTTDPSVQGCAYPSTASSASTTPTSGSGSSMGTPSTTMPNGSPLVTTPTTGGSILGGGGTLGPTGIDTDMSQGGVQLPARILLGSSVILAFSALLFW